MSLNVMAGKLVTVTESLNVFIDFTLAHQHRHSEHPGSNPNIVQLAMRMHIPVCLIIRVLCQEGHPTFTFTFSVFGKSSYPERLTEELPYWSVSAECL